MEVAGGRVGRHQHLAVDRHLGVHDFFLPFRRDRHRFRRALMRQHRLDFAAEYFFIILERRFAIAVVEQIGIDLHRLLLGLY